MTIEMLIEKLQTIQKSMPGALVKFGDFMGPDISPIIQCCSSQNDPKEFYVCLADSKSELNLMFSVYNNSLEQLGVTKEVFYKDLFENFTLEDIKTYVPKYYEEAKEFYEKLN